MKPIIWHGCYDSRWDGFITSESFAHPAKFSRGLIERILDHCIERGWLSKGDTVVDCFGGIGTGGVIAAYRGLAWVGCELEPRFVKMAQDNFALHAYRLGQLNAPMPVIVQGDSRQFDEVIAGAGAIVTSPPYSESLRAQQDGIDWEKAKQNGELGQNHSKGVSCHAEYGEEAGQIGRLRSGKVGAVIASPPYAETSGKGGGGINVKGYVPAPGRKYAAPLNGAPDKPDMVGNRTYQGLAGERTDGNIETLKLGTVSAVVSSPPYSDIAAGAGGLNTKPAKHPGQQSGRTATLASQNADQRYGATDGQISRLKSGTVAGVVTSPPFEDQEGSMKASKFNFVPHNGKGHPASETARAAALARRQDQEYGNTEGQIGQESGETYWQAVDAVYRACFRAIKPGGIICLVVKDYIKNRQRVPLCDDTARLLEHIGFTPLERIHAMLVKEKRHNDLFEQDGTLETKSRKSFFRRLAEKKGSPRIDYEEVLIFQKPL